VGFRETWRQIWTGDADALARAQLGVLEPVGSGTSVVDLPADVAAGFGVTTSDERVTRQAAMQVPAVARGRSIICGVLGSAELYASRNSRRVDAGATPQLLSRLDPRATPQWTLTWTVDDGLFYGIAWWRKLQVDPSTGYPTAVERLAPGRVRVDGYGMVYLDGRLATELELASLIRFDFPDEGILSRSRSLRTAILLEDAVRRAAGGQPPQDYLAPAEGAEDLEDHEIDAILDTWATSKRKRTTAFLNKAVEHHLVGFDPRSGQLAEARQYQAAEVARLMNLDPGRLGAPTGDSMTYATTEGERRDLVDVTLRPFITALEQRLSMPDLTPHGQRVHLDMLPFMRGTTLDAITSGSAAVSGGLLTREEVRQDMLGRTAEPAVGQLPAAPAPAPEAGQ